MSLRLLAKVSIAACVRAAACAVLRKRPLPQRPRRVLILMCNWLGDSFWATQAIPMLKEKWPDSEIWAGVKPFSKELLFGLIPDERVIILENIVSDRRRERFSWKGWLRELRLARSLKPDLVLDLTGNRWSALFSLLCGGSFSVGPEDADEMGPLYSLPAPMKKSAHLSLRPMMIVSALTGLSCEGATPRPPRLRLLPEDLREKLGIRRDERIALLAPGAGWQSKSWSVESFAALAQILAARGLRIVALGSPSERAQCEAVVSGLPNAIAVNGPLSEAVALISSCSLAVSNDSGLSHLAAAFGVPTVVLACSTNPDVCGALGSKVKSLRPECPLSPRAGRLHCEIFPATECHRAEHMAISAEDIVSAIDEML